MSVQIFRLPLFPLSQVLFPHIPLPLHIFEDRYKAMIQECIAKEEPFGVALIEEGAEAGRPATPCKIGCTARIVAVKPLEGGRMEVLAVGEERFRLLEYRAVDLPLRPSSETVAPLYPEAYKTNNPYLIGYAEKLHDAPDDSAELQISGAETRELFIHYLQCLAAYADTPLPRVDLPDDPLTLSYYIGAIMKLPQEIKQQLLTITETQARLDLEMQLLRREVAHLEGYASRFTQEPTQEPPQPPSPEIAIRMREEEWDRYFKKGRN